MKRYITGLFIPLFFLTVNAAARDLVHLNNGETIKGHIVELKQGELTIVKNRKHKNGAHTFTSEEVKLIEIDARNVDIVKLINREIAIHQSMCNEGFRDATLYHRRFIGNFALGFFFNIIGFTIVAVSNPKAPDPLLINDMQKLNSTEYLLCYEKKARKKNITAAGIGLAAIVILGLSAR